MNGDFVTIERIEEPRQERWQAIVWSRHLDVLGRGSGASPQAALQNAIGVLGRQQRAREVAS